MPNYRSEITKGMLVKSRDGAKLGLVVRCDEDSFEIERGLFFTRDYTARYADIAEVRGDEIYLAHGRDDLTAVAPGVDYPDRTAGAAPMRRVRPMHPERPREEPAKETSSHAAPPYEGVLDEEEARQAHDPRRDPDAIVDDEAPVP